MEVVRCGDRQRLTSIPSVMRFRRPHNRGLVPQDNSRGRAHLLVRNPRYGRDRTGTYGPTAPGSARSRLTLPHSSSIACQFMALHSMYIKDGDGFALVFSLTSLESVNELQSIREQIHRIKEGRVRLPSFPLPLSSNCF